MRNRTLKHFVLSLIPCLHGHHSTKKPVTTMLTYPWECTVLHCNHLGNTWKPLVLMTRHFDYCNSNGCEEYVNGYRIQQQLNTNQKEVDSINQYGKASNYIDTKTTINVNVLNIATIIQMS